MRRILLGLVLFGFAQAEVFATEILIRRKQVQPSASALSIQSPEASEPIQKKTFKTEAEKEAFVKELNPEDFEWEENQVYQATDYVLDAQTQAEVNEEMKADPLLANQWSLFAYTTNPTKFTGADIDAIRAWTVTQGSDHVMVYVVDSGITQQPEPDLKGRVVSYFDAIHPGSFPDDQNGHGTHVASIISAQGSNDYGIKGVVPDKVQVGAIRFLNEKNQGSTDTAMQAMDFIVEDMKTRRASDPDLKCIVNNSWDGGYSSMLESAMKKVADMGCLLVTSAGNNGRNNDQTADYPCNFEAIRDHNICVGATGADDKRAAFSSYGAGSVHLYAPGVQILSIVPGYFQGNNYVSRYEQKSGTSQAVPHVSGAAALVWAASPKLSATEVRDILVKSVDRLPGADQEVMSGGRLNAYRAVLVANGKDPSLADRNFSSESNSGGGGGGCSLQVSSAQTSAPREVLIVCVLGLTAVFLLRRRQHRSHS